MLMRLLKPLVLLGVSCWCAVGTSHALVVTVEVQDDVCGYGSGCIIALPSGGVGSYTFLWSPVPPTGQGTAQVCGLFAGIYQVTVTDSNGDSQTVSATVATTPELLFDTSPGATTTCTAPCTGYWFRSGTMGGEAPYTVTVDPPAGTASASGNWVEVNGLCAGTTYSVTIEDANGCMAVIDEVVVQAGGPPEVVSISQQGICQGFPQDWAQVIFDQDISQITVVAGTATLNWSGNTATLYGLNIGTNVFNVLSSPLCSNMFVIEVEDDAGNCGTIQGSMRADVDANCIVDPTDPPIPNRLLRIQPGNYYAISNAAGAYSKAAAYGTNTIASEVPGMGTDCLAQHPVPVELDAAQPTATVDFLLTPMTGPDAEAFIGTTWFRPGFATTINASARNNNAFAIPGITLAVDYDPMLAFDSAPITPAANSTGHIEWVLPALQPYETIYRSFVVNTPNDVGLIGTNVSMTASITMPVADAQPLNDNYTITRTIIGSYDPNDKLAQTSSRTSDSYYYTDLDDFVDFTIRFQNTGTAEAIDVFLLDTIADRFDLSSFEFLASSHPTEINIEDDRVLRFDFPDIWLPDSTTDPLGSQGFASFRLKPMDDLVVGETLTNAADIYFDFNEPVRTNTAALQVDLSSGIGSEHLGSGLQLAPNPVHERLRITAEVGGGEMEVLDPAGRKVITALRYAPSFECDVSDLANGIYVVRLRDENGILRQACFVKN